MSASLVYLPLRQVLRMLTQLARDDGAKDVELLVLRHQLHTPVGKALSAPEPRPGCGSDPGCPRLLRPATGQQRRRGRAGQR